MKDLKEIIFRIYDFFSNESGKLIMIILLISLFLKYISTQLGLFDELNTNLDKLDINNDLTLEQKNKNKQINQTFLKYCKNIIDTHSDKINLYDDVVLYLMLILGILLLYFTYAGLFTYIVTPKILENGKCGWFFKFLRFIFKWPLFGFLFTKNRNIKDILDFKLLGVIAKQFKLTINMSVVLLYLIYVVISVYVIHEFKNNNNNCYVLRNIEKKNYYPEQKEDIQKDINKDIFKYHTIYHKNIIMIIIIIILYGFNSDILENFAALFVSNKEYIEAIKEKLINTKCS